MRPTDVSEPPIAREPRVAIVHDYLTQRGGAERVVLMMHRAFPDAPIFTSFYDPAGTFDEFAACDVRTGPLNGVGSLRRDPRRALPVLAPLFSRVRLDHDVVICSSSGWAHGVRATGAKIVYCHNPPRWLYAQRAEYVGRDRLGLKRGMLRALEGPLRRWDRAAARSADRYLANSRAVRARIAETYGIDAEILPPPPGFSPDGPARAVAGVAPGYLLVVSRLQPYKNVGAIVEALASVPAERLVVAGGGVLEAALRAAAPPNVRVLGVVPNEELRWLYANAHALVAASFEDYGLTPLEAAVAGKPSVALRAGGFLDTVVEGRTGVFFDTPGPGPIAAAIERSRRITWDPAALRAHADLFSEERFAERLRSLARSVAQPATSSPSSSA